jgi:predicted RNA-binding Zn-ribbon protein involved in translation (DUF1610 family)
MFDRCRYSEEEFRQAIANSLSIRESLGKLGLKPTAGNYITFHKKAKTLEISTKHFKPMARTNTSHPVYALDEILIESSHYTSFDRLKIRLLEAKLLSYECSKCHISEWNNEKISLHLDHINGIRTDNRLENLRFLCPNCHSQTETYSGKNRGRYCEHLPNERNKEKKQKVPRKINNSTCTDCGIAVERRSKRCRSCSSYVYSKPKIEWPTLEELQQMVQDSSYVSVGKKLGVSDSAVRKHILRHQTRE